MKKVFIAALVCILVLSSMPTALCAENVRVKLDALDKGVEFDGWGTSLCWWAEVAGTAEESARKEFSELLFGKDGLELNIVRYNVGAGDASGHKHMRDGGSVPAWIDENGSFNPLADEAQLKILQDAVLCGADIVELFSNSPPYYLTVSGCAGGGKDPNKNNIEPENFGKFADYLATVAAYIQNEMNIKVNTVEPMNEPGTNFWGYEGWQEGCHIDSKDHSALIVALRKALDEKGLGSVGVAAADENSVDRALRNLNEYTDEALATLSQINTHTYNGTGSNAALRKKADELGKPLYMSEVDGDGSIGYDSGEMGPALWLSQKITDDMKTLRPNGWVLWQAAPAWPGSAADTGYWNLCQFDVRDGKIDLFKKYYAYAQYTKFIKKGDVIISTDNDNVLAARNPQSGKLALVITNAGKKDETFDVELSALDCIGTNISAYRTDNSANLARVDSSATLDNGVLRVFVPKDSVVSVVVENSEPKAISGAGINIFAEASSCFEGETLRIETEHSGGNIVLAADSGSIDQNGVFTADKGGRSIVTATLEGTNITASQEIDVIKSGDLVRLLNVHSSLCATQNPSGGYIQCSDNDSAYQYWTINVTPDGMTFKNLRSKELLNDNGNVLWKAEKGNGGYGLVNTVTKKGLDAYGFSKAEGSQVGTYEYGGGTNQLWNFRIGHPERIMDELRAGATAKVIVPDAIYGTSPYGGNEDVSYEKAFDGDVRTHHDAWDGSNSYLEASMPSDAAVNMIRFYPRDGFAYRMYGGTFVGVKDGEETLLYTVPDKLKSGWNEVRLENDVIYDEIIYRTPKDGLCNVAEIQFLNWDYDASLEVNNGVEVSFKNYGDEKKLTLVIAYSSPGVLTAVETKEIPVGKFARVTQNHTLNENYEWAQVFLLDNGEIISSGYIYMKGND